MPDNIYGINVGQVETPTGGGIGNGRASSVGGGNAINTLLRFQQKMAEIEADKQKQATQNANTLFQGLVKTKGSGAKGSEDYLGFTPANEYEANIASTAMDYINQNIEQFAKSGQTNEDYAMMQSNIDKTLNDPDFVYAVAANKRIASALKTIQDKGLDVHPLYWDQYKRYQNAKGAADYDLRSLLNPQEYKITPVDAHQDYSDMEKMGIDLKIETDPETQKNYVYTTQDNKDQVTNFVKNKYRHNFEMDFDQHKLNQDAIYQQYGDNKDAYVDDMAKMASDELATVGKKTFKTVIGETMAGKDLDAKREIEKTKTIGEDKLKNQKELENLKHEHSKERIILQAQGNKDINAMKKETVEAMGKAMSGAAEAAKIRFKDETGKDIPESKLIDIASRINPSAFNSEEEKNSAYYDELTSYKLNSSKEDNDNLYKTIQQNVDAGNKEFTTFKVAGNKNYHDLIEEKNSPAELLGKNPISYGTKEQTFIDNIDGLIVKGSGKVATGSIITKNSEYYNSVPKGYNDQKKQLTDSEVDEYIKRGYKMDKNQTYYKVPVEIPLSSGDSTIWEDAIGFLESGNKWDADNPTSSAYGRWQFVTGRGLDRAKELGLAKSKDDYLQKMKDPEFQRKIFKQELKYNNQASAIMASAIEDNSSVKEMWKNFVASTIGADKSSIDNIPDWIIKYLFHHQGSIEAALNVVSGKWNENQKGIVKGKEVTDPHDVAGLKKRIIEGYKRWGLDNIEGNIKFPIQTPSDENEQQETAQDSEVNEATSTQSVKREDGGLKAIIDSISTANKK